MNVGLIFGSFNPIHIGHLIIAEAALNQTDLDKVWFVVTPQSPHKTNKTLLHEFDRLHMVELAINDHFEFSVCDIEFNLPKPNYTINTLINLSEKHRDKNFSLIIGGDNLSSFKKWKNYEVILNDYNLIVYPRPGAKKIDLEGHKNVKLIEAPMLDISASYIRRQIKDEKSVKYLLSELVFNYIESKGFYK